MMERATAKQTVDAAREQAHAGGLIHPLVDEERKLAKT